MDQQNFPSIGIACEGRTDRLFIERLIFGYYAKQAPDFKLIDLFPQEPRTKKDIPEPAGWSNLIRYLKSNKFDAHCKEYDLIIIQIDSDICEQIGVRRTPENPAAQMEAMTARLAQEMGEVRFAVYAHKLVFAVCVESLECWVLPFYYPTDSKKAQQTINCIGKLNPELQKLYQTQIGAGDQGSKLNAFQHITADRPRFKPAAIQTHTPRNPSLSIFWQVLVGKIEAHLAA